MTDLTGVRAQTII